MSRNFATLLVGAILAAVALGFWGNQTTAMAQIKQQDYKTLAERPFERPTSESELEIRLERYKHSFREAERAKDTKAMLQLLDKMNDLRWARLRMTREAQDGESPEFLNRMRRDVKDLTPEELKEAGDYWEMVIEIDRSILSGHRAAFGTQETQRNSSSPDYEDIANEKYENPRSEVGVEEQTDRYFEALKKALAAEDEENVRKLLEKVDRLREFQWKKLSEMAKLNAGKNSDFLEGGGSRLSRANRTYYTLVDLSEAFDFFLQKLDLKADQEGQSYNSSPKTIKTDSQAGLISDTTSTGVGLTGRWTASFFCNGKNYPSIVRVEDNGVVVSAYMDTSTPCIPSGGLKFSGESNGQVTCVGENSSSSGTRQYADRLFYHPRAKPEQSHFRVCRRIFRRELPEI